MIEQHIQRVYRHQLSAYPITAVTLGLPLTFILKYCEQVERTPILQGNWRQLQQTNTVGLTVAFNEALSQLEVENQQLAFIQQVPLTELSGQLLQACLKCIEKTDITADGFTMIIQFLATLAGKRNQLASMEILAKLASQLLDIRQGTIYDGTAAFGLKVSTLAQLASGPIAVSAQERDPLRWLVGKLNFYLHQIPGEFALGDVLAAPAFCRGSHQASFDYALMTAPFSASYTDARIQQDRYQRFKFGIPNRGTADLLFVQNTLAALNSDGRAILLVSTGLLNRTGQGEGLIKQKLVAADLIETIITLPAGIWTPSAIGSVAIIVVAKHKRPAMVGKIHLIDASRLGSLTDNGTILSADDLQKIAEWNQDLQSIPTISTVIANNQVRKGNLDFHQYFETQKVNSAIGPVVVDSQKYEKLLAAKVRLKDIATVFRGMNINRRRELAEEQGPFATIKLADVTGTGVVQTTHLTQLDVDAFAVKKYLVNSGDVIVACRGTQQKVAVIPKIREPLVLSSDFIGLRLKATMDPWYVKSFFDSPFGSYYLAKLRRGSQRTILNYRDVAQLLILDSPLAEQRQVGAMVQATEQRYLAALKAAEEQRQQDYWQLYDQLGVSGALDRSNS